MLWIATTLGAASLQVARNALQRGLLGEAGPWGATLVRFLFGLPFAVILAGCAAGLTPGLALVFRPAFFVTCLVGGAAQIAATAAMLVSMRRSSFTLGSVLQQSSIPLAALLGLALGDRLGPLKWVGLALVTAGMAVLAWPRGTRDWTAGLLGLAAAAGFAITSNVQRQATHMLEPNHPVVGALVTVVIFQAIQSAILLAWLLVTDRGAIVVIMERWRSSLPAGLFGAAASSCWFTAFALAPAGPVRALGVVETPLAALVGRRLFAERVTAGQLAAGAVAAIGVALAALG